MREVHLRPDVCLPSEKSSKGAVDAGDGVRRLFAISCFCFSVLMPRDYSYPSAKVWAELYESE
jgi:hypothetical protein